MYGSFGQFVNMSFQVVIYLCLVVALTSAAPSRNEDKKDVLSHARNQMVSCTVLDGYFLIMKNHPFI